MDTYNMHDAKTQLSRLVQRASHGESIVIARSGQPLARLVPFAENGASNSSRLGFLAGRFRVPDDFDRLGADEIADAFDGEG